MARARSREVDVRNVVERDETGRVRAEGPMQGSRRVGRWRSWHASGALASEGGYRDGLLHGSWISWSPEGHKTAEGSFRRGQRHGSWKTWHASGARESEGRWDAGAREGEWRTWDEAGRLSSRGRWRRGRREGRWLFDAGAGRFATEWHRGELTDRRGARASQPTEHRGHYYPVVPGQDGFETPFDRAGHASGLCFGFVPGMGRLSYLFRPPAPVSPRSAGGLFLAIVERRQHLWLLEKRFAAHPGAAGAGRLRARAHTPSGFFVFQDPLAGAAPRPEAHATLAAARRAALAGARRDGVRRAVGALIESYPLDF